MPTGYMDQAVELIEKSNTDLQPDLMTADDARALMAVYARAEKLVAYGLASLARKVDDASEVARATGTSMGKAHATLTTGKVLKESGELSAALQQGDISLDQATEIAKAEAAAPGAAEKLLPLAQTATYCVLKDKARALKLEAEQHKDLAVRQREARCARSYTDELGMVHIRVALEPHVGTPIVARAEAEAARLARAARAATKDSKEKLEPFERYLADAYASMLSGKGKGRAKRPELVVLVSHEVAKRGWKDVRAGEVCKIPGVGPVPPQVARSIAADAFLNGVFYDGQDLRQLNRWSSIPVEVAVALELGPPPDFDGVKCVDCGNRFHPEADHDEPRVAGGPYSNGNLKWRCWGCHKAKTEKDRRAGKLKPPEP